jgi:uncharacterized protein YjbI with pentapeptide repeats
MIITCEKCGGKSTPPKGKTTFFCSFCGNQLDTTIKKEEKQKVGISRKGSDKETILEYIRGGSKGILNLPMADLKGIHLKGANLEGANLRGANLAESDLTGAKLKNADLSNACLDEAIFNNADLSGANLENVTLYDTSFYLALLIKANLSNAYLRKTSFEKANLSEANLTQIDCFDKDSSCLADRPSFLSANLTNATFEKANLGWVDFNKTNITLSQLRSASNIQLIKLSGINFHNADLSNLNLRGVHFVNMDMSGADLSYSDLSSCEITESNLKGVKLKGAKVGMIELKNLDLSETDFSVTICKEGYKTPFGWWKIENVKFINSNLSNLNLEGQTVINCLLISANLSGANLKFVTFSGCNLTGADLSGTNIESTKFHSVNVQDVNFYRANFCGFCEIVNTDLKRAKTKGAIGLKKEGCFLTTACVEAMKLPDDCHELQMLRKFRDGYVSETLAGRELIKEYYNIAPGIIEAVNSTGNGPGIFMNLYSEISEIVSLIDNNKPAEAYQSYCDMTLRLKKKYLS